MEQKDKELLIKDVCARLPYGIKFKLTNSSVLSPKIFEIEQIDVIKGIVSTKGNFSFIKVEYIKPYLRPLSSMTEEETKEHDKIWYYGRRYEQTDWFNAHHFDYRGLIEKGLAIEVTEENNPYK